MLKDKGKWDTAQYQNGKRSDGVTDEDAKRGAREGNDQGGKGQDNYEFYPGVETVYGRILISEFVNIRVMHFYTVYDREQ